MTRCQSICAYLTETPGATLPMICAALGLGRSNASSLLRQLINDGKVIATGIRRKYQYYALRDGVAVRRLRSSVFDLAA